MDRPQVVVVGAGVAGLACARELARRGGPAVVLDRARGVGGRCATRHVGGRPVDFGTFYLHAQSAAFAAALGELDPAGRIEGWPERVREPKLACQPDSLLPGAVRFARRDGVSAFPRHLARGLDVRLERRVTALAEDGPRLRLEVAGADPLAADVVVVAGAVTESLALVEPLAAGWPGAAAGLERIRAVPFVTTLAVMAGYGDAPPPDFDAWFPLEATMLHAIGNDSSKRAPGAELVLVLQARPRFSLEQLDAPPAEWTRELVWEAAELLGPWAGTPRWTQSHAWRTARVLPRDVLGEPYLFEREPGRPGPRVVVAGDAFAPAAGVEAAYLGGVEAAERIARLPG
jgi:hypothetical protein